MCLHLARWGSKGVVWSITGRGAGASMVAVVLGGATLGCLIVFGLAFHLRCVRRKAKAYDVRRVVLVLVWRSTAVAKGRRDSHIRKGFTARVTRHRTVREGTGELEEPLTYRSQHRYVAFNGWK